MLIRMLTSPVLAIALLVSGMTLQPAAAQNIAQPLVRLTDLVVNSVDVVAGQLVADATATLNVVGRTVKQDVQIPLTLGGTASTPCDILNLSLGPVNLDLLGLVVNLDDCNGGPVTVDITGGPGAVGELLCSLAGALDQGVDLGSILDQLLTAADVAQLTTAITDVLNEVFDALLTTGTVATAAQQPAGGGGHVCPILMLEIPNGLNLNVLGLIVDTSPICLDVHAESGSGNLLGNLLCNLSGLLNTNANTNALQSHVQNILRLLNRLGL